jgi:hypothetical protein
MGAKDILVKPISAKEANDLIKRVHYSGKTVNNSQVHMGVFYGGRLEGALQFGPSLDKGKIQGLVADTSWNGFVELNRMAFTDALPRNSESRAIAVAMRLLKKHAPHIEWVISFADGTQCGDGTIYRASGFELTGINPSNNLAQLPNGEVIHKMTLESNPTSPRRELGGRSYYDITNGKYDFSAYLYATGAIKLKGFQLRYIYFIDPQAKNRLKVPILPFTEIAKQGATMYKGVSGRSIVSDASDFRSEEGGATPTLLLQTLIKDDPI